jgi:hypothetical protein
MSMQNQLRQNLKRALSYLLISLVVLYIADWSIFEVRMMRGVGLGSVPVEQYLKTPLKGSKAEYDYLGTGDVNCSVTMFPQFVNSTWNSPCWWLKRHKVQWQ